MPRHNLFRTAESHATSHEPEPETGDASEIGPVDQLDWISTVPDEDQWPGMPFVDHSIVDEFFEDPSLASNPQAVRRLEEFLNHTAFALAAWSNGVFPRTWRSYLYRVLEANQQAGNLLSELRSRGGDSQEQM